MTNTPKDYAARVRELEAEGMTTSDAQAVADAEQQLDSGEAQAADAEREFHMNLDGGGSVTISEAESDAKQDAGRSSRMAERIENLEMIVVYLMQDYLRGEKSGGFMEWEDVDTTHDVACSLFPDLKDRARAEVDAESEPDEDEEEEYAYDETMGGASPEDQERANGPRR